jgi:hypothetical protein
LNKEKERVPGLLITYVQQQRRMGDIEDDIGLPKDNPGYFILRDVTEELC